LASLSSVARSFTASANPVAQRKNPASRGLVS